MQQYEILKKIKESKIVAIVRVNSIEEAIRISKACAKGNIKAIEITYTISGATEIIKELKKEKDMIIGAGTILDPVTARIAILAGAEFIVSPGFDKETAKICNLYQIPYIPGCMTITEIITALKYGASIIKLFPSSILGPESIKTIKAPLPNVNIMPTGGVSIDNIEEWFKNGVIAVGIGGKLSSGTDEEIITKAKLFKEKIEG